MHVMMACLAAGVLILCLSGCSAGQRIEVTRLEDLDRLQTDENSPVEGRPGAELAETADQGGQDGSGRKVPENRIAVYVRGAVSKPGVYYLDEGARVYQAIEAAGGFAPDADTEWLNQAEALKDGQMLTVNTLQETSEMEKEGRSAYPAETGTGISQSAEKAGSGSPSSAAGNGAAGGLVNLNTADKDELMTLPGIGESKAESIIRYREENGAFASPEDVMNISGIKEAVFSKIKDRIYV